MLPLNTGCLKLARPVMFKTRLECPTSFTLRFKPTPPNNPTLTDLEGEVPGVMHSPLATS